MRVALAEAKPNVRARMTLQVCYRSIIVGDAVDFQASGGDHE